MNLSALEQAWDKQTVAIASSPPAAVIARLKAEVRSAERRFQGARVIAISLPVLGWVTTIAAHVTGVKTLTSLTLISQVVGSALYVALLIRAMQSVHAVRHEIAQMGGTLRESTAATSRTIELQIANARIAAVAIPLVVASGGWLFLAKYFAGEIPGFSAALGSGFAGAVGALIGGAIWHRYRTVLIPRRRELNATLELLN